MTAIPSTIATRAALYLRVSTARQAEHDVSIPDQKRQGEAYCLTRGYQLVDTFVEPGASATNDRRPEFQRMIEAGTSKPAPFDVVVVHSFSRFFRDHFELEFYVRKLAKNGVRLVSITQEMGDDPMHVMMRQIMALFDEYQSKENAKHVIRALKENARQGFWNGSLPPIGYRVVAAEQRGAKVKKKLEVDPLHADTIRLIYRLALQGDGEKGQMGVKSIADHLNRKGIRTRDGGRWGIGQVHRILTRRTYMGEHEFNKRSKTKELKPADEVVPVPVPPIIDGETFAAVQKLLKARNPKVMPARVVSGPTLLTGLIHCAKCGGAMTIRTGKGGRYRYYTCSMKARQGATACSGMTVPMAKLDDLVVNHLEKRLLAPERLETILATVLDRRQARGAERRTHIAELNKRATEADQRLKRLYDAIETGVADLDDVDLKDRIATLKVTRDQARTDADRASALLNSATNRSITPEMLEAFAKTARQRMRLDGGGYRRDHLRALAQRVEVSEGEVRIMGSKGSLLQTLAAIGKNSGTGAQGNLVPISVPNCGIMSQKNRFADSTNRADFLSEIGMGKSNLQASLEKKYAAWSGELLEVQKQILKIEESHAELSQLRTRAAKLEELVGNAKSIFFEVNPEWDGDQVKPLRPGSYTLPFEIGTVSKECMTILREYDKAMTSREIAKLILERQNIIDADWQLLDRVRSAVDACMRSRRGKYVQAEGEYPIYWSIIPA